MGRGRPQALSYEASCVALLPTLPIIPVEHTAYKPDLQKTPQGLSASQVAEELLGHL